jgi:hypothetical protein
MTPSGIEPATSRFVAYCLNHYATARAKSYTSTILYSHTLYCNIGQIMQILYKYCIIIIIVFLKYNSCVLSSNLLKNNVNSLMMIRLVGNSGCKVNKI